MPHLVEKCLAHCELFFQGLPEPGPRVLPVPVSHRPRKPQRLPRLLDGKAAEQVQLRDLRRGSVLLPKSGEQFVQRQNEVGILGEGIKLIEQLEPYPPATSLQTVPIPGMVDQDPPHRFRGGGEEMPATVEVLVPDQAQVSLVDQGRGVEGVPGDLGGHFRGGESPQFVIDQGEQFRGGAAVSLVGGFDEMGQIRHKGLVYTPLNGPSPDDHAAGHAGRDFRLTTVYGEVLHDLLG
jgi:hypothetical protein